MNRKKKLGLMLILGMGILYVLSPTPWKHLEGHADDTSACAVSIYKATRLTGLDVLTDYTCTSTHCLISMTPY